jgi:hypothetical protein
VSGPRRNEVDHIAGRVYIEEGGEGRFEEPRVEPMATTNPESYLASLGVSAKL